MFMLVLLPSTSSYTPMPEERNKICAAPTFKCGERPVQGELGKRTRGCSCNGLHAGSVLFAHSALCRNRPKGDLTWADDFSLGILWGTPGRYVVSLALP